MSTTCNREMLTEIFEDTYKRIKHDPYLSESVSDSKKKTTVFLENDYPDYNRKQKKTTISVSKDRSFEAVMKLSKIYNGRKIAVLNFANAFHPGGGVKIGATAQEECLCRTSTLYPLLENGTKSDMFYKFNSKANSPKATDSLIYIEDVVIFKSDEEYPVMLPKEKWIKTDVITMAAPDLRDKSNRYAELINNGTYMNDAELFGYHVKRAIHMLTVAASKNADILVLGAFGCGAFRNNPEVVAKAYNTAFTVFPKVFEHIEFAVYCDERHTENYKVFCNEKFKF